MRGKINSYHHYGIRPGYYRDNDALMKEAHAAWDGIPDARHQHDDDMMIEAITELSKEDLQTQRP